MLVEMFPSSGESLYLPLSTVLPVVYTRWDLKFKILPAEWKNKGKKEKKKAGDRRLSTDPCDFCVGFHRVESLYS